MKKIISILLVLVLLIGVVSISTITSFAANDALIITITGTNQSTKTVTAHVGDVLTFSTYVNVWNDTQGSTLRGVDTQGYLEDSDFRLTYDDEYVSMLSEYSSNTFNIYDRDEEFVFPKVNPSVTCNFGLKNAIYFNFATPKKKYLFKNNYDVMCQIPVEIKKAGTTTINVRCETMSGLTDDGLKIVTQGKVEPGKNPYINSTFEAYPEISFSDTSNTSTVLSWSAYDSASTYDIYRVTEEYFNNTFGDDEFAWTKVGSTSQTTFTDTGLKAETKYLYYIEAKNASGAVTHAHYPYYYKHSTTKEEIKITATQINNSIVINWNDVGAKSYNVYYKENDSTVWHYWTNTTETSLTDTGVVNKTHYIYGVREVDSTGPIYSSNTVYYVLVGFQKINGNWYYFDKNGQIVKGLIRVNGEIYYLDPQTGIRQSGWKEINGYWYYFNPNNSDRMVKGWVTIGNAKYYCDPNEGMMLTGWQHIDGEYYHFKGGDSGRMDTGWYYEGGAYFYLDSDDGHMYRGFNYVKESGGYFYFRGGGSGRMLTGWVEQDDGSYRYFRGGGSGRMLTGWQNIGGSYYYLEPQGDKNTIGKMYEGCRWVAESNGYFCFRENGSGRMYEGWAKLNDGHYRYCKGNGSGRMLTGWQYIGGAYYYLEPSDANPDHAVGEMYEGCQWVAESNGYFCFRENGSGRMYEGWALLNDGHYRYCKGSGSGRMLTGWQNIGGSWFYLEPDENSVNHAIGEMYEGRQYVNGKYNGADTIGYWYFKPSGSGRVLTGSIEGHYYNPNSTPIPGKE